MFWWLLVSLFGLISAFRTTRCHVDRKKYGARERNQLLIAVILFSLLASFVLKAHVMAHFLFSISIFLTPMIISRAELALRRRYFLLHFVSILDEIILEMRMGRSLREALQKCSKGHPVWLQKHFDELLTAFSYRQAFFAHEIPEHAVNELREIFVASMRQLERLKSLRRRRKIEMDFRQKSRKALVQVRMQSGILALLFVPLLIFQLANRPWHSQKEIVIVACALFAAGSWWIVSAGRNYRWKI